VVLKEVCKANLRYAENLARTDLDVKVPKSTLHYWEVKHGGRGWGGVEGLLRMLTYKDFSYSMINSTKFMD
jgi:hypothetical protein